MKQFEYLIEEKDTVNESYLNYMGKQGWELVQAHLSENGKCQCLWKKVKK